MAALLSIATHVHGSCLTWQRPLALSEPLQSSLALLHMRKPERPAGIAPTEEMQVERPAGIEPTEELVPSNHRMAMVREVRQLSYMVAEGGEQPSDGDGPRGEVAALCGS